MMEMMGTMLLDDTTYLLYFASGPRGFMKLNLPHLSTSTFTFRFMLRLSDFITLLSLLLLGRSQLSFYR
jgi:hypothetical protein